MKQTIDNSNTTTLVESCRQLLKKKEEVERNVTSLEAVLKEKVKEQERMMVHLKEKYSVNNLDELRALLATREKKLKEVLKMVKQRLPKLSLEV